MTERTERIKVDGVWVTRIWDAIDETAAIAGNAVKRISQAMGPRANTRKRPATTVAVTGQTLTSARQRRFGA